jgi:hypothetical protein
VTKKEKKGWTRDQRLAMAAILVSSLVGLIQIVFSILPLIKKPYGL